MNRKRAIVSLGLAASTIFCGMMAARMLLAATPGSFDAAPAVPSTVKIAPDVIKPPTNVVQDGEPKGNPLWAIPLVSLSATRERPIFTPSRRPPASVVAAPSPVEPAKPRPPVAPERPQLTLVGTIIGDATSIAVFTRTMTKEAVRLRMGEGHDGWILRSVKGREATLQKDSETAVLGLMPSGASTDILVRLPARRP